MRVAAIGRIAGSVAVGTAVVHMGAGVVLVVGLIGVVSEFIGIALTPSVGGTWVNRTCHNVSKQHRIAIIIPFIGEGPDAIPSYLQLFCDTAAGSAALVDFLIVHDGVLGTTNSASSFSCPENVIFHSLENLEEFSRALVKVTDRKPEDQLESGGSREKLAGILAQLIRKYPYVMVEFKPALGHVFEDLLKGYSHWGYSDLDIMFGDLERWITPDELNDFDIVTYGFGDQEKVYLRGQFTFHRNDPETINQLWRSCDYLSHMDKRFANVKSGKEFLSLESAEGCYSEAVLNNNDIKIKYAVKAFTDVQTKDTAYTHGVYVGTGKNQDRTVIYKAGGDTTHNPTGLATLPQNWFETKGSSYANPKELLYKPVGERERLLPKIQKEDVRCMHWVKKKYQSKLCIDDVDSTDTIYWIHGQLYKEKFQLVEMPGGIATAPFFHFQEWKRFYRKAQLGGFQRNGPFAGFVLTKEGILPFYKRSTLDTALKIPSPLGHSLFQWHGVENNDREQLPRRLYCLQSATRKRPSTTKCKFMTSWWDSDHVEILSGAPAWSTVDSSLEVTMAITLQLHADQVNDAASMQGFYQILGLYLNRWQGQPTVIVVHVAGATSEFIATIREKLGPDSDLSNFGMDTVLVGAIFSESPDTLSRKALMNMAIDASPTRFVISGYELERGIVPSQDTAYLAHRTAQTYKNSGGAVYVIPQFGLMKGAHDYTIGALEKARLDGDLGSVSKTEEGECETDNAILENEEEGSFGMIEKLWWQLTQQYDQNKKTAEEITIEDQALALEKIQSKLTSLLTEKEHYNLYATDSSPILLFDNLGPRPGMLTSDMVREIDEFGGKMCYNSIRLAQMATLGYHVHVLAGAFAISTPALREAIGDPSRGPIGVSRCDVCFFFTKEREDEDILEVISLEERQRPAKIAILWEQSNTS
eukprot:jgi/Psemu1/297615/fgenesh1_pm.333_\